MAPPTILAHKSSFLTAQTLQLSQALAPSPAWRASNSAAAEGSGLSDKVVDEVLYRANHTLQQHARRVYAPQASRHVAEQIERLYLEAAEKAVRGEIGGGQGGGGEDGAEGAGGGGMGDGEPNRFLRVGADFASDDIIASLPSTWDLHSPSQSEAHPSEAQRYAGLATSLTSLAARRHEARDRLERLRRMRDLLAPVSSDPNADDGTTGIDKVQSNLVTRDGEMEKELERMRMLLVRVAARVDRLPDPETERDEDMAMATEDLEAAERGKVERLLDDF
ncbi:kinetochore Sim4 complex subunit Fta4 [Hypomontagnella submonticulosa]|nr:kinetochore Sim4 complex subunit Fta4 [Hypomontagnella submonticulosa]